MTQGQFSLLIVYLIAAIGALAVAIAYYADTIRSKTSKSHQKLRIFPNKS